MSKQQAIQTDKAPAAIGPYSQGITLGEMVFTSGQIPLDPATGAVPEGVAAQAELAMQNLGAVLAAAGSGFGQVVKTTCFLASMDDFATFNEVYARFFTGDPKPARSCVAVKDLPKGVLVEVEAIAYK
ncbi:MAG: RidA family protein [Ruminococcaceae bacterium]|nr:RidA family protein [Oscillospiraceae bacterium]